MGTVIGVPGLGGDSASEGEQGPSSVAELDDDKAGEGTSSMPGSCTPSWSSFLRASSKASAKLLLDACRGHMDGRLTESDDMLVVGWCVIKE
jgi:hypothetical protein